MVSAPIAPTRPTRRLAAALVAMTMLATTWLSAGTPMAGSAPAGSPVVEATVCGDAGGIIVRLYRAYFNRVPDPAGLAYWGGLYLATDIHTVAHWMAQSTEYQTRWAGTDDTTYVEQLLYDNLLGRAPDTTGLTYWVNELRVVPRARQVIYWVQAPEMILRHPSVEPPTCRGEGVTFRAIPGGQAADIDYAVADLQTSARRCSVASINGNWLTANGTPIGLGVIGGHAVPGGFDRQDRGIIGEYHRPHGPIAEQTYVWDGSHLNANLATKGDMVLEVARDWQRPDQPPIHGDDWRWAASGIVMVIKGQKTVVPSNSGVYQYTFLTRAHSFVAFKAPSTVTIGSTTSMTAVELVDWLLAQGYTDIVKMDGGGSVEFNRGGRTQVAGTSRPIPVWIGVGC